VPALVRTRNFILLVPLILALLLALVFMAPSSDATTRNQRILRATSVALAQIGDRYVYGAAGPNAFDCSGLTSYSYHRAGLRLARTSSAQARQARHIRKSRLRRGDLMFFGSPGNVHHVGIFLRWANGHARMVHSPGRGQRVQRARPWTTQWFAGTLR
jgi:cell wall-associated NlpC family hydrolase